MKIIEHKNIFLAITAAISLAAVAIILIFGLRPGIDFTGGALTEVSYDARPAEEALHTALQPFDLGGYTVRETIDDAGRDGYLVRTRDLTEAERQQVHALVAGAGEAGEISRFTSIGPVIGEELKSKAIWAVGAVALIIVLYVAFAFRGVRKPVGSFVYGGITILSLLHDVLIPAALMSILGYTLGAEVDVLFVMALLAILGYSVNDTIVIFDRVRENLVKYREEHTIKTKDEHGFPVEHTEYTFTKPFSEIVGTAVNESLARSINTSLTTFLAVLALYIFGGDTTRTFALMLIAGIVAGTYSSIFFASPLLVYIEERLAKKNERAS